MTTETQTVSNANLTVVAAFLLHIQRRYAHDMTVEDRDLLAETRILVDVLRGDGI